MTRRKRESPRNAHPRPPLAISQTDRLRPWLLGGLMALLVARPLFPSESAAVHGDGLTVVMLWIALAVFWLLGAVGRSKFSFRFGGVDAAVLALVLWHTVAALWACTQGSPRPAVNMLWEWVGMGLCFLLARQFITTAREARATVAVMIALAVALAAYGLYQYAYEMPQTRADYAADPDLAMRETGLWFPPGSPERKRFEDRLQSTEPIATFALTNSLAGFLAPWLVILAAVACLKGQGRKRILGLVLCLIPVAICLILTKSRGGYIATGAGLAAVGLCCRKRTTRFGWKAPLAATGGLALLVAVALAVGGLDREVFSQASKSLGYRVQYWQSSLRMIADHPWVGCGPGNFQEVYTQYKLPEASEEITDPHNFLLEIWATSGTPAMAAFLVMLGCFVWSMFKTDESTSGGLSQCSFDENGTVPFGSAHPPTPAPSPDAWLHVLAGGVFGFLLAVPLGTLSAAPPGTTSVFCGLPPALATLVILFGWIRDGRLPSYLPALGIAVLLIHLLAAGGIGLPSVAGTFWLLLALGLQGQRPHACRTAVAWAMLAAAVGLAVACYWTAYAPVLGCQARLRLSEREPTKTVEHLEAAATADPLSAEPWRRLAAIHFERWRWNPSEDGFQRFKRADARMLELAPQSTPAWSASGDRYFRASAKTDRHGEKLVDVALLKAVEAYRQAVRLYPNSAMNRAKLAEAYRAAGDLPAFRHEAEAALRLDKATPHNDKKLPADLRDQLLRGPPKDR